MHAVSLTFHIVCSIVQGKNAPVDTMGCHKCHDDTADEKTQRYHILIALMLSSQTKDQTNFAAMQRLREHGLTPENMVASDVNILEKLITPVSFYKVCLDGQLGGLTFRTKFSIEFYRRNRRTFKRLPSSSSMNIHRTFQTLSTVC